MNYEETQKHDNNDGESDLRQRVRRLEATNRMIIIVLVIFSLKLFSLTGQNASLCGQIVHQSNLNSQNVNKQDIIRTSEMMRSNHVDAASIQFSEENDKSSDDTVKLQKHSKRDAQEKSLQSDTDKKESKPWKHVPIHEGDVLNLFISSSSARKSRRSLNRKYYDKLERSLPFPTTNDRSKYEEHGIISKNDGKPTPRKVRKLQSKDGVPLCNGSFFRLELNLDENAKESSWELRDEKTNETVDSRSYNDTYNLKSDDFSKCLPPGPYTFILRDMAGDGIKCKDLVCYNVSINDQWIVESEIFVGKKILHSFNSSSPCYLGDTLDIQFSNKILSGATWIIKDLKTKQELSFEKISNDINDIVSYRRCMSAGSYAFDMFDKNKKRSNCRDVDDCVSFSLNNVPLTKINYPREFGVSTFFYITRDGLLHEQLCPLSPILTPTGSITNSSFDELIPRKLDIIYSLSKFQDVHEPGTPQYRAACKILYDDPDFLNVADTSIASRYASAVFLYSMNLQAEVMPTSFCNYDVNRIECDDDSNLLTKIDFGGLSLNGIIPNEIVFHRELNILRLDHNNIEGTIPTRLGQLWSLKELILEGNNLRGTIISEIGNLMQLQLMLLGENSLTGTIPSEIGSCSQLGRLGLNLNKLEGTIPDQLYNLSNMYGLGLYNNRLNGTLSSDIEKLQNLNFITIENNKFIGTIPSEIGGLNLIFFSVNNNAFTGGLPTELRKLENITKLILGSNRFSGTISDSIYGFSHLQAVDLSNNLFHGTIPSSISQLENLVEVMIENNKFEGEIGLKNCSKYKTLLADNSKWFVDEPKVECDCCSVQGCHVWDLSREVSAVPCPEENIHAFNYTGRYDVIDQQAKSKFSLVRFNREDDAKLCLSPTGCYEISYDGENKTEYNYTYSSHTSGLDFGNECSDVSICDEVFNSSNPKRTVLNHLTQIVKPDFLNENDIKHKAMCWILNEDENNNDDDSVCDGTLLQRFVIVTLFLESGFETNLVNLVSQPTCNWDNIKCDSNEKFVEEINLNEKKLIGTIITEIGLLKKLKVLNLAGNKISGTLDPRIFANLPDLQVFNVGGNRIGGSIPKKIFNLERISKIDLSNNLFELKIPDDVICAESLEHIDFSKNILRGALPSTLANSQGLKSLNVSENSLTGDIPKEIGYMKNLTELRLNQNRFLGTIPPGLFDAKALEILMMHNNELTGSVPSEIKNLQFLRNITMNHNSLKSSIPTELGNLENLQMLHLQQNKFTGTAPEINGSDSFITDCNSVSKLVCKNCSLCCDEDGNCKPSALLDEKRLAFRFLWYYLMIPIICAVYFLIEHYLKQRKISYILSYKQRDALSIYNDESVYSYIFSKSILAWSVHLGVLAIQLALFFSFLWASDPHNEKSLVLSSFKCLPDSIECPNSKESIPWFGWGLFYLFILLYLGSDIVNAMLQTRQSLLEPFSSRLLINGLSLMCLTIIAIVASYSFNKATAASNTDLIVNAVTLLFINDLDEQTMTFLSKLFPEWAVERSTEIIDYMKQRQAIVDGRRSLRQSKIKEQHKKDIFESPSDELCDDEKSEYRSANSEEGSTYDHSGATFHEADFENPRNVSFFADVDKFGVENKLKLKL